LACSIPLDGGRLVRQDCATKKAGWTGCPPFPTILGRRVRAATWSTCRRCCVSLLLLTALCLAADESTQDPGAPAQSWAPPGIDQAVPPVQNDVPCPLPEVLHGASARVKELTDNLQQFTANERIEHIEVGKKGQLRPPVSATFTYVANIKKASPGFLQIDEYRNGTVGHTDSFPAKVATTGTAGHALILHPDIVGDYNVTCEGLGSMRGQRAWQLRFVQRADRPSLFRQYRTPRGWFNVALKGRAWIAVDSYQVVRIETDLVRPVPQILLFNDHVVIDYGPVNFAEHNLQLWLPETIDIYMAFLGHRAHRRHSFSNYQLFWVDLGQKIDEPQLDDRAQP